MLSSPKPIWSHPISFFLIVGVLFRGGIVFSAVFRVLCWRCGLVSGGWFGAAGLVILAFRWIFSIITVLSVISFFIYCCIAILSCLLCSRSFTFAVRSVCSVISINFVFNSHETYLYFIFLSCIQSYTYDIIFRVNLFDYLLFSFIFQVKDIF